MLNEVPTALASCACMNLLYALFVGEGVGKYLVSPYVCMQISILAFFSNLVVFCFLICEQLESSSRGYVVDVVIHSMR
jgi:hypothetical protein